MAKYQIYFDTITGETKYNVDIDEEEMLETVWTKFSTTCASAVKFCAGDGEPQVVWNGQSLDFAQPLPEQGVHPNDVFKSIDNRY